MQLFVNLHRRFSEVKEFEAEHPGSYWSTVHASAEDATAAATHLTVAIAIPVPIEATS
jgi:hypothetical protein